MASILPVKKLGIPTIPHYKPYSLEWLNESADMKISNQTLSSFSIGKKYRENVLCDVVPMSGCHLLLGCP